MRAVNSDKSPPSDFKRGDGLDCFIETKGKPFGLQRSGKENPGSRNSDKMDLVGERKKVPHQAHCAKRKRVKSQGARDILKVYTLEPGL